MSMASLWTDRPAGSDHDWLTPPPPPARRNFGPPPPPEPPRKRGLRRALIAGITALVVAAAVLAGTQIGGDSGRSETAKPLSASTGRPAETRINQIYARVSKGVVNVQVQQG